MNNKDKNKNQDLKITNDKKIQDIDEEESG